MRSLSTFLLIALLGLATPALADKTLVLMETSLGNITLELDAEKAPQTVENFLRYVDEGHYAGTVFHRVIDDFMIQGGGFDADLAKKDTHDPVQNEAKNGLQNLRGTIAMARTNAPHSAAAQFFINVKDNGFLDYRDESRRGWGYCVFGKVTAGMEVADKIAKLGTTNKTSAGGMPMQNVPIETPVITRISRIDSLGADKQ